jgi:hypothetical protein
MEVLLKQKPVDTEQRFPEQLGLSDFSLQPIMYPVLTMCSPSTTARMTEFPSTHVEISATLNFK